MKWIALLVVTACGGVAPAAEEPAPAPAPRDQPGWWFATVALAPVNGGSVRPTVLRFEQAEGELVRVTGDAPLRGLRPGRYHLVVHEGEACGPDGRAAGPKWIEAGAMIVFDASRRDRAIVDQAGVDLMLDGEMTIIGRALVLHGDRGGHPGEALACGVIERG